jgi:tRNA threonylcarbamoyladenosine biosynthesis protein TsaB
LSQLSFGNSPVLVLSLDTTTRAGSAALVEDGRIRAERTGDPSRTHGERLPTDLMRVLEDGGVRLRDVDLLAVATGPGSFTGLRVGISAMQGLAVATGLRVVPVSALDALARAGADSSSPVAAWMDAQRRQVFAALYRADAADVLLPPTALPPDETLDLWSRTRPVGRIRFIGDGATRYSDLIDRRLGADAVVLSEVPPLAGVIGRMALERPERAVTPHAIVPVYVRRSDAEIARLKGAPED